MVVDVTDEDRIAVSTVAENWMDCGEWGAMAVSFRYQFWMQSYIDIRYHFGERCYKRYLATL